MDHGVDGTGAGADTRTRLHSLTFYHIRANGGTRSAVLVHKQLGVDSASLLSESSPQDARSWDKWRDPESGAASETPRSVKLQSWVSHCWPSRPQLSGPGQAETEQAGTHPPTAAPNQRGI